MYRLTISGSLPTTLPTPLQYNGKKIWQRVYRWNNVWGIYNPSNEWEKSWITEKREFIHYIKQNNNELLLENVEQLANSYAPPPIVDDLWEEQVVIDNDNTNNISKATYGMLWSFVGSKDEISNICKKYELSELDTYLATKK